MIHWSKIAASTVVRFVLFAAGCVYLGFMLVGPSWPDLDDWFGGSSVPMLLLLITLSLLQWTIEGRRFYTLNRFFRVPLSQKMAVVGTFRGISVGMVFPNKLGQVVGRLSVVPQAYLRPAVKAHFTGVLIQSMITLGFGITGWAYHNQWYGIVALLSALALLVVLFLVLKSRDMAKVLCLTLMRYGIILLQYVLILSPDPALIPEVFAVISLVLAILSFVPGFVLGDLATREALLIAFLGGLFDHWTLVGCGLAIWLVNLVIPACIGGVLWWKSGIGYKSCMEYLTAYKTQITRLRMSGIPRISWFGKR